MLPDSDYPPADRREKTIKFPVALDIALQLRSPIPTVRSWCDSVDRADVPEAPVNEDGESMSRKGDICRHLPTTAECHHELFPEPETAAMKLRSNAHLGARVGLAI